MAPFTPLIRAAGVAGFCCFSAATLQAQRDDRSERLAPEVRSIDIRGNDALGDALIRRSIATRATRCRSIVLQPFCWVADADLFTDRRFLDDDQLARDVLRIRILYWRHGYREAQVDTAVARPRPGRAEVTFTITEGPPVRVTSLTVLHPEEAISPRSIERSMQLRAGDPLDLSAIDSTRAALSAVLWDRGYADAIVTDTADVDPIARTAAVRLTMDPRWIARVGEIRVFGLDRIDEQTVLNTMEISEGDIFRRDDLIRSQRRLYASNLFRQAEIREPAFADSVKPLDVLVQEAALRESRASVGFNTLEFFQVDGRFTHFYAFGGPRRLDVRGAIGNLLAPQLEGRGIFHDVSERVLDDGQEEFLRPTWQVGVDLVQPWFLGSRNTLGGGVFAQRRSTPGIFIDEGYGAHTTFTRRVAVNTPASVSYRYELTQVRAGDLYFCVNYGICELNVIEALRGRNSLSPLSFGWFAERNDDPLDPTRGYTLRGDIEHASAFTLSNYRYNRITVEATRYIPAWRRSVLAGKLRVGFVSPMRSPVRGIAEVEEDPRLLHPRKRYYAGGARSVRGYPENQLGPTILTVDPEALIAVGCTVPQLAAGQCPNLDAVPSGEFQPRPTGGTSIIEGSIEWRFPVWRALSAAFFMDAAVLGETGFGIAENVTAAATPGFGVRYASPVGPIRVDLGIRPTLREVLPVVTQVPTADGTLQLVQLAEPKIWDPLEGVTGARRVLARLTLHLSIGQAF